MEPHAAPSTPGPGESTFHTMRRLADQDWLLEIDSLGGFELHVTVSNFTGLPGENAYGWVINHSNDTYATSVASWGVHLLSRGRGIVVVSAAGQVVDPGLNPYEDHVQPLIRFPDLAGPYAKDFPAGHHHVVVAVENAQADVEITVRADAPGLVVHNTWDLADVYQVFYSTIPSDWDNHTEVGAPYPFFTNADKRIRLTSPYNHVTAETVWFPAYTWVEDSAGRRCESLDRTIPRFAMLAGAEPGSVWLGGTVPPNNAPFGTSYLLGLVLEIPDHAPAPFRCGLS